MGRSKYNPAPSKVVFHKIGKHSVRSLIKCRGRLIKNPHRSPGNQKLRHGKPPLLAGGEITEGQVGNVGKADNLRGLINRHALAAGKVTEEILPEAQVFRNGQFGFHGIAMAEIMAGLRGVHVRLNSFAGYLNPSLLGTQQTRHRAQQRGFSRAVAPGQHQRLSVA